MWRMAIFWHCLRPLSTNMGKFPIKNRYLYDLIEFSLVRAMQFGVGIKIGHSICIDV